MDMNEAVSKAIAAERSAAHMTIKELAEKSGVPERTLIRLLKNERNINVMQVAQISTAVGIYPHELIESAERFMQRDERGPIDQPISDAKTREEDEKISTTLEKIQRGDMTLAAYVIDNKQAYIDGEAGPDYDEPA